MTKTLFKKYRNVYDFANADISELENDIKPAGFFRNKAKNIIACCKLLISEYGGKVPDNMDDLLKLPGVGRKTANVILSNAFGKDAIAVDTHVFRVSNRLGLADSKDVLKTEYQLMDNIPKELWSKAHHWLIYHGRNICTSRKPKCEICPLAPYCKYLW